MSELQWVPCSPVSHPYDVVLKLVWGLEICAFDFTISHVPVASNLVYIQYPDQFSTLL